jgi:IS6 family transposase
MSQPPAAYFSRPGVSAIRVCQRSETYQYRAVEQHGQIINVMLSVRRDMAAGRAIIARRWHSASDRSRVTPDRQHAYPRVLGEHRVLGEQLPAALHVVERYAHDVIQADKGD